MFLCCVHTIQRETIFVTILLDLKLLRRELVRVLHHIRNPLFHGCWHFHGSARDDRGSSQSKTVTTKSGPGSSNDVCSPAIHHEWSGTAASSNNATPCPYAPRHLWLCSCGSLSTPNSSPKPGQPIDMHIFNFLYPALLAASGADALRSGSKVKLSSVQSLTLRDGAQTSHRRVSALPQVCQSTRLLPDPS
jgi:hypothetical protein